MATFWAAIGFVLLVFYLLIIARLIVETTRSFARSWRPVGTAAIGLEVVYVITDPPMKALRRIIPPLRIGGISLDMSVLVLLIVVWILKDVAQNLAASS